jgi:hypothetical protein
MDVIDDCHVNLMITYIFSIHLCKDGIKSGNVQKRGMIDSWKRIAPRKPS